MTLTTAAQQVAQLLILVAQNASRHMVACGAIQTSEVEDLYALSLTIAAATLGDAAAIEEAAAELTRHAQDAGEYG